MTKIISINLLMFLFCISNINVNAQEMDNEQLNTIFQSISNEVDGAPGNWQFIVDSTLFICLTDELHNRMRIIAPIEKMENVTDEQLKRCMQANFHTSLDVRYSISDEVLWSAFIHPLKELTQEQVMSGISQVYSCTRTFGTTYSSGALAFPTQQERDAQQN